MLYSANSPCIPGSQVLAQHTYPDYAVSNSWALTSSIIERNRHMLRLLCFYFCNAQLLQASPAVQYSHLVLFFQGLGELYEEEFVAATTAGASTAVDKHDAVRLEARTLMKELFGKLDALSHFQYAPKPVIEEMQVRADVPALAMEEVAPQVRCAVLRCAVLCCNMGFQGAG